MIRLMMLFLILMLILVPTMSVAGSEDMEDDGILVSQGILDFMASTPPDT